MTGREDMEYDIKRAEAFGKNKSDEVFEKNIKRMFDRYDELMAIEEENKTLKAEVERLRLANSILSHLPPAIIISDKQPKENL